MSIDRHRLQAFRYATAVEAGSLLDSVTCGDTDAVRVGTWFRAKGLEFPHVFLPDVQAQTLLVTGGGVPACAEKEELARRALFVAMTRARDTLWIGRVAR